MSKDIRPFVLTKVRKGDIIIADDFRYDPEAEEKSKGTRLPFGLCKAHGIKIQDWWTPSDAWNALKSGGYVTNVSEEYAEYYRQKKREREREKRKQRASYNKKREAQRKNPEHNPDPSYSHQDGKIAGVAKGAPMSFEQADSGKVNPYFGKGYIGYRHNCQTCVATYIARRQGYDVRALPNLDNRNIRDLSLDTALAYVDRNGKHPSKIYKPYGAKIVDFLQNNVNKGDIISVEFDFVGRRSGHIITAERGSDGTIRLYDPQTNEIVPKEKIAQYFRGTKNISIMKLTNARLDERFCDKIMKRGN